MKLSLSIIAMCFSVFTMIAQDQPDNHLKYTEGDELFKVVEDMPRFPGCEDVITSKKEKKNCSQQKLLEYIYNNLQYPKEAKDNGIEGRAILQFVVQKNGSVGSIKIIRNPGGGTGEAAKAVIEKMNTDGIQWIAGKQRGKLVHVLYTLPVLFKLDKKAKSESIKKEEDIDSAHILEKSEKMPLFPGCEDVKGSDYAIRSCAEQEMMKYVYSNLTYPADARSKRIEGMAIVSFVINKDGSVSDIDLVKDPGAGTGDAALDILRKMMDDDLRWIPGENDGEPVRVRFKMPVKFKLY